MRNARTIALLAIFPILGILLCGAVPAWAEDEDGWESTIHSFEAQDRESMPPEGAVLFVGSSSIRLWNLDESFPDLETINRGFGGSTITDVNRYAERIVIPYQPATVVFYAGDNDINRGDTPEEVFECFKTFVGKVQSALPKTEIIFISIKPSIARWKLWDKMTTANELIEAFCEKDERLTYVDLGKTILGEDGEPRPDLLMQDGLHLNEDGYAKWNEALRPYLADAKKKEPAAAG
jgi:lysophospholipase L1-like esterase